jgi:glycosyltransferase involved in cell wall biosynthesis
MAVLETYSESTIHNYDIYKKNNILIDNKNEKTAHFEENEILERQNRFNLLGINYYPSSNNLKGFSPKYKNVLITIPAYNEEATIGYVAIMCKKYADKVVVVNDGSKDHTLELARIADAEVVSHRINCGYGAAIKTCFEAAKIFDADIMITIDGDGQHNPDDIPTVVEEMLNSGSDIVIGSRFIGNNNYQNIPIYRKVGMKILDVSTMATSGLKLSDTQSGFRAYSRKAINSIELENEGMGAGSEILIKAGEKGLKVTEAPIRVRYNLLKTSSQNPVKHGFDVLNSIMNVTFKRMQLLLETGR